MILLGLTVPVHFADGTKTTVRVGVVDLVSDLMEKVHDKLTSSASKVWVVDNEGKGEREIGCVLPITVLTLI